MPPFCSGSEGFAWRLASEPFLFHYTPLYNIPSVMYTALPNFLLSVSASLCIICVEEQMPRREVKMMRTVVKIGRKLKEVRKARLLTQSMLADRSGVTQATIARIENNHVDPHFSTIHKLASALRVEPEDLLD